MAATRVHLERYVRVLRLLSGVEADVFVYVETSYIFGLLKFEQRKSEEAQARKAVCGNIIPCEARGLGEFRWCKLASHTTFW